MNDYIREYKSIIKELHLRRKEKIIISSKAAKAEKEINEFLETIDGVMVLNVQPIVSFSGPSLIIGALISYMEDVDDDVIDTENSADR